MKIKNFQITTLLISQKVIFVTLSFLSFSIPFFLGHSQIITGTIVNASLFLATIYLPKRFFWPMIFFPSLAVLSRGLIFGPFTPFLIHFLPMIWLGNFLLIYTFRNFSAHANFFLSVLIAALVKWLTLYLTANIFFKFHLVPRLFLTTMGINQFITAILGGLLAYLFTKKYYHGRT